MNPASVELQLPFRNASSWLLRVADHLQGDRWRRDRPKGMGSCSLSPWIDCYSLAGYPRLPAYATAQQIQNALWICFYMVELNVDFF